MKINRQENTPNFGMKLNIDKKSIGKHLGDFGLSIVERATKKLELMANDTVELSITGKKGFIFNITKSMKVSAKIALGEIDGKMHYAKSKFNLWTKPILQDQEKLDYGNLIKCARNLLDSDSIERQIEKFNILAKIGK